MQTVGNLCKQSNKDHPDQICSMLPTIFSWPTHAQPFPHPFKTDQNTNVLKAISQKSTFVSTRVFSMIEKKNFDSSTITDKNPFFLLKDFNTLMNYHLSQACCNTLWMLSFVSLRFFLLLKYIYNKNSKPCQYSE